ncbi:uncharacterized protein DNG_09578 [Cephalotrichum gorgonifer]|uniref:Rhodopsin domain-containing protein n=1 Tax=Cephalotrichum gorgonifer TaxID=2041049 RepID=A0AAE8SZG8_9PEZI|nr:uncharacterized protein DNG_09578 [Cephalotrichum gorgonifer]
MTVMTAILGSVSLTCIALRLMTRPPGPTQWTNMIDDWVMIVNTPVVAVFLALGLLVIKEGFGRDLYTLSFGEITTVQKVMVYAYEIMFSVTTTLSRISILCFYLRVFPFIVLPALNMVIRVTMVVVVAVGLSLGVALVFQCTPVSYVWDWWKEGAYGHCIDTAAVALSHGALSIALDIWIMLIPLPEIRKLHLPLRKKISVGFIFVAWVSVIGVVVPRTVEMKVFKVSQNATWNLFYPILWGMCEGYATVICACMPRIYMLFSGIHRKRSSSSSMQRDPHLSELIVVSSLHSEPNLPRPTANAAGSISPITRAATAPLPLGAV